MTPTQANFLLKCPETRGSSPWLYLYYFYAFVKRLDKTRSTVSWAYFQAPLLFPSWPKRLTSSFLTWAICFTTLKEGQKLQAPAWKLAGEETHFTKYKIEAFQVKHLETSLIHHSSVKLVLHNIHVPIRSKVMLLSLGFAWKSAGKLEIHWCLSFISINPDLTRLGFSLVIRIFKNIFLVIIMFQAKVKKHWGKETLKIQG